MILSELILFLKSIDASPKKSLSQNFLIDANIVEKIVELAQVEPNEQILEIGPGPGTLTKALLKRGARVTAVELDRNFAQNLSRLQNGNLTVVQGDFLKFSTESLAKNIKVVANLPYHITTPILEKLFASSFSSITIMVQKEVATRMMAIPGTKDFSSLSLFVQFHSTINNHFNVPAPCFYPKPNVDSTVIRLDAAPIPETDPFHLVHPAFQKRRKMITSSLNYPKDLIRSALVEIGARPDARPEMLNLNEWIQLTKRLSTEKSNDLLFQN